MQTKTRREYLSPDYKLIEFFRSSRDGWKRKAQQVRRRLKKAKEQLKQVRARRDYWKELAQAPPAVEPRAGQKQRTSAERRRIRPR